jgi:hypothetical protein
VSALGELVTDAEEAAGMIRWHVGVWQDLGYETPPGPGTYKLIPPLGERSAEAIKGAHAAIDEIDQLTRKLFTLREMLAGQLRQNEDALMARLDAKYGPTQ